MVTRGYKGLQWVTGDYKGLQGVTRGDRGLQGVSRGYRGLQGNTGVQRIIESFSNKNVPRYFFLVRFP